MSILENHTTKYKPFVNPFYKEGIGRRTGAVLKTEVRKDSDGFEIFDDYFSESEADNSELSFAVDKENISASANRSRRTGRQKLPTNQKRSSPLRPMKSFSPAASTDRSVVRSSDDFATSTNKEEIHVSSGKHDREDTHADPTQDEAAGKSAAEVSLSDNKGKDEEEEVASGLDQTKTLSSRGVAGKNETKSQLSDEHEGKSSSEETIVPGLKEKSDIPEGSSAGKSDVEVEPSSEEKIDSSSEEEVVHELVEKVPARDVTGNSEEVESSDRENRELHSEEEVHSTLEKNERVPVKDVAQEDESKAIKEGGREQVSGAEEKIVATQNADVQDKMEKELGQVAVELNGEDSSSEKNISGRDEGETKYPEGDLYFVKEQPNIDSPLQAQIFALTKKRLSFSCAAEENVPSSSRTGEKVAVNREEKMNDILENLDKEELVCESQEKPSFMDMINSKRTSGAVFSFRFSEILSSTANVSNHQSQKPDDDNFVILSEEKEKSIFGKTVHKQGRKASAKSEVEVKGKSEKRSRSKGAGQKLKGNGKSKDKSDSDDRRGNETVEEVMERKDETTQEEVLVEKSKMIGSLGENEDAGQNHQDGTSLERDEKMTDIGDGPNGTDVVDSEEADVNHIPDDSNAIKSNSQDFIEGSEDQSTTEVIKEDGKSRSLRTRKSTSRANKEENATLKSVKKDSRKERKHSDSKNSSEMEKTLVAATKSSDEDDEIVIRDGDIHSTTGEVRTGNTTKRRSSRRLKSTSEKRKEKNNLSRVEENTRRERDGSNLKNASDRDKTAATEVSFAEDDSVFGGSEVHSRTGVRKEGMKKNSRPLRSTSKAKKEKTGNQSRKKEKSKTAKKGSDSKMTLEDEEVATLERTSNEDEDQIVYCEQENGSTQMEENEEGSNSEMSSKTNMEKATGKKKLESTAGKGRRKSKKQESESASQEDEDEASARDDDVTSHTGQRRSKRIRSKTESESDREGNHSDKELNNLQRKSMRTKNNRRAKEMQAKVEKDGSSPSGEAEALKEEKRSKLARKSEVMKRKGTRSKAGKRKSVSLERSSKNVQESQLEGTKSKRTRRTTSLASFVDANRDDEETEKGKEISDEDDKELESTANKDEVKEDGSSSGGSGMGQGDTKDTTDDLELKGSSRKRKSTTLHSTKTKVKRGDKTKVERIYAVKKTLDYTEEDNLDEADVLGNSGQAVDECTHDADAGPTDPESDKTSPNKVSPSKEREDDSGQKEEKKNNSSDQQQTDSSIPQSILKSSKVYQRHRKHRRQRNLRLTFHEIAKPKALIIPPNREQSGTRRSKRNRVRPLEYWRNERAIYERRKSGGFALMGINSPESPTSPHKKSQKGRKKQKGMHTRLLTPKNLSLHRPAPDGAIPGCSDPVAVVNPETQREVLVDVVKTPESNIYVGPSGNQASDTDSFILSKALMQPAFSSGILTIRPESKKGLQLVQRDTMVFHIVRGKLAVTIHQTTQILESGAFFFVPQGNVYNIVNLRKDVAKLIFFQLKGSLDI